jgi:DNA-directed RNA polymerase specialized sigma24 family protein
MASAPPNEGAEMSDEEVRRVSDALNAVEQIADEEQRVKAQSRIMAEQLARNKAWAPERTRLIRRLHREEGLSYRQIAARLEIKLGVVQDAFRNYTESGKYAGRGGGKQAEDPQEE